MWHQSDEHIEENIERYKRGMAVIDLDAIKHNLLQMKELLNEGMNMYAVIKTNGYGHGSIPIAKALESAPYIRGYAVATPEEAMELRGEGIKKEILILGYSFPYSYEELIENDVRITVFREDSLEELDKTAAKLGKNAIVHIALDTGMGRIGITPDEEGLQFVKKAYGYKNITVEGMFSHFARADETDKSAALKQLKLFKDFTSLLHEQGLDIPVKHISNSAAILELPESYFDAARAGITMYGLKPSEEVDVSKFGLKPALSLYSTITYVKTLKKGRSVSYGGLFTADRDMKVATVPLGYGDGYPRLLTGKGEVIIKGRRCPILGRICMDQFMVDVSGIEGIKAGEKVTLIGNDGNETISAEELGERSGRFNYELVCLIGARIPRVYLLEGKPVLTLSRT